MELYGILVDLSPTFYCLLKPLFLYGSMILLSYISTILLICTTVFYVWWLCIVINISVQYNGGFLPDISLLTQGYHH